MSKLIEALQILLKYGDPDYPFHCEHDVLMVCGIDPATVAADDKAYLRDLGFLVDESEGCFKSYRYGSC